MLVSSPPPPNGIAGNPEGASIAVRGLQTSNEGFLDTLTPVACRVCRLRFRAVTYAYLKFRRGIETPEGYKVEFRLSKITSLEVRRRVSEAKRHYRAADLEYMRKAWGSVGSAHTSA